LAAEDKQVRAAFVRDRDFIGEGFVNVEVDAVFGRVQIVRLPGCPKIWRVGESVVCETPLKSVVDPRFVAGRPVVVV